MLEQTFVYGPIAQIREVGSDDQSHRLPWKASLQGRMEGRVPARLVMVVPGGTASL
ncbi:hypothetical protein THTE_1525 [Thermogutta terrifontis]|uniref:Uncharacterized protein n=1 Tax=Thermogutta terrifontis TaxID=1331910 RepID=A0A286RDV6_9BACT|nr:hypothetical protein THTE_1525 [Thermogutta terrifontis]